MTYATSVGPGERSLEGLGWLARVGASPIEPLCLVMGWGERVAMDHVRRLVAAGLVRRMAMTRGDGSLLLATRDGCARAGYPRSFALRGLGPTNWHRTVVRAWVSAGLHVRGREYWSERQIGDDLDFWERHMIYRDYRGTAHVSHRPDLGVFWGGKPAAIELELIPTGRVRLLGILRMYAELTEEDGPLSFVVYVAANADVEARVKAVAKQAHLYEGATITFRTVEVIVDQARQDAHQRHTQLELGRLEPAVDDGPPADEDAPRHRAAAPSEGGEKAAGSGS